MIKRFWNALSRWHDLHILWPEMLAAAHGDIEHALGAFASHTLVDPAWDDLNDEQVNAILTRLWNKSGPPGGGPR